MKLKGTFATMRLLDCADTAVVASATTAKSINIDNVLIICLAMAFS
jgi:hypothetical protein